MAAGIPGIGIGGLFYMLHALLLPLIVLFCLLHGVTASGRRISGAFHFYKLGT